MRRWAARAGRRSGADSAGGRTGEAASQGGREGVLSRRRTLRFGVLSVGAAVAGGMLPACGAAGPEAHLTYGQKLMSSYNIVHDPCLMQEGGYYYVYSTGFPGVGNGNIQMRVSKDLVKWDFLGTVFPAIPAWITARLPNLSNLWAPDLSYYRGRYQLYYACYDPETLNRFIALATNRTLDPNARDYHWVDEGLVIASGPQSAYNTIDPSFITDARGNPWLVFGSYYSGIKLFRLDAQTRRAAQTPPHLYSLSYRPIPPHAQEAPFLFLRRPHYYLFTSIGACCDGVKSTYRITVGRADAINGSYIDASGTPMIVGGGTLLLGNEGPMIGPGGQSIGHTVKDDYLVYHYYDALDNGNPHLQIRQLRWSASGWPVAGPPIMPIPGAAPAASTG